MNENIIQDSASRGAARTASRFPELLALALVPALLMACPGTAPAQAPIRDQGRIFGTGGFVDLGADSWSQSITTGTPGFLAGIQIQFDWRSVPLPGEFELSIIDGGNPPTGRVLFSEQRIIALDDLQDPELFTWDVSEANLFFATGDALTFGLRPLQAGFVIAGNEPPGYPRGELFRNGAALDPSETNDIAFISYVLEAPTMSIETFGNGEHQFTMRFVDVEEGDVPDDPYGAVPYNYRMGVHEVGRRMIEAYNALSGRAAITMADMTPFTGNGPNRPATGPSWNEAARFVNWLNTSRGCSPAYKIPGDGANDPVALWTSSDHGFDPDNPFRNGNAFYFLPSENEWFRAAYFDPDAEAYWTYATGSNVAPTPVWEGTASGTAVYWSNDHPPQHPMPPGPAEVTNAGGLSPFGTMAQSGNVWEWCESAGDGSNDVPEEDRVVRGGMWQTIDADNAFPTLRRWLSRGEESPENDLPILGFRVASKALPAVELTISHNSAGSTLLLRIDNLAAGRIYHLRGSTDGRDFAPLFPWENITIATPQPIAVPIRPEIDPLLLLQVYSGATPDP